MKKFLTLIQLAALAFGARAQTVSPDLVTLTRGVAKIGSPGAPGRVCVFGDAAFPVVVGKADKTVQPVVGAGRLGTDHQPEGAARGDQVRAGETRVGKRAAG